MSIYPFVSVSANMGLKWSLTANTSSTLEQHLDYKTKEAMHRRELNKRNVKIPQTVSVRCSFSLNTINTSVYVDIMISSIYIYQEMT